MIHNYLIRHRNRKFQGNTIIYRKSFKHTNRNIYLKKTRAQLEEHSLFEYGVPCCAAPICSLK